MAKNSAILNNNRKKTLGEKYRARRCALRAIILNKETSLEERFRISVKLSQLPRNSSRVRVRERCEITGRPRGVYRQFKLARVEFRDLALKGYLPGVTKSSW